MDDRIDKLEFPIGRLAPSPTGAQHLGNARTFLLAWLSVRNQRGKIILRIEDLDTPRIKPWATAQALEDLHWLGLDWDIGPAEPTAAGFPPLIQSLRLARYRDVVGELHRKGFLYPCSCTRREVEEAASAPHEGQFDESVYPGTCAGRSEAEQQSILESNTPYAWRFRMPAETLTWHDEFRGIQSADLPTMLGDFVVARMNRSPAYQLAVVVDDHDMGVTEVVRGDDLVASTYRQLILYRSLGWTPPKFYHVPLVVGPDGRRLAKRHGDTRLSFYREAGILPQSIMGYVAWTAGLQSVNQPAMPADFLGIDPFANLPREPVIFPGLNDTACFK